MTRLSILLLFLLATAGESLQAQTPVLVRDAHFQVDARAAIDSLYNRNPAGAEQVLQPWKASYPDHPLWPLMDAMEFWWVVLNDLFDESYDEELLSRMKMADERAAELLSREPDHPDGWMIRAVATGYMARQQANRGRWLPSVTTARRAMIAHTRLGEVAPELDDNLLAEGLKKYYAAYLPETYRVIRAVSWLLPDGDREEGLQLLEVTSRNGIFARPEAIYFMGNILLNYEHDYARAVHYFSELVEMYPDNSYYRRLYVRALFNQRQDAMAERTILESLNHWEVKGHPDLAVMKEELLYWQGRIRMRSGRFAEAHDLFKESFVLGRQLPNTGKRSFHVLSSYHAGVAAERSNDNNAARYYYEAAVGLEAESDVRRLARDRLRAL